MIKNPHVQTFIGFLRCPRKYYKVQRTRIELCDGDFIDYDACVPEKSQRLVIILPGLAGGDKSHYVVRLANALYKRGVGVVIVRYRGSSGVPNRNPGGYHFGMTDDLLTVYTQLMQRFIGKSLAIVGFSMGGNLLLHSLSKLSNEQPFSKAIAVSIPFCLHASSKKINDGFASVYQWHMMRSIKQLLKKKRKQYRALGVYDLAMCARSFLELDQCYTAPMNGYGSRDSYYDHANIQAILQRIDLPVTLIQAKDDPIVPYDINDAIATEHSSVDLILHERGGHVGFWSYSRGKLTDNLTAWLLKILIP